MRDYTEEELQQELELTKEKVWDQYYSGRKVRNRNTDFKDRMKKLQNSIK